MARTYYDHCRICLKQITYILMSLNLILKSLNLILKSHQRLCWYFIAGVTAYMHSVIRTKKAKI
jgi:hypothetical protein